MNNSPGSNPHKVSDLYPGIIAKLQGRTDITMSQASYWVKRALENLTESEIFEELRRIGPLVTIGPGLMSLSSECRRCCSLQLLD